MASLASVADLVARGLVDDGSPRLQKLLDDASAAIRAYTGQTFERGAQTIEVWPSGCCFEVRGKDVATVSATFEANPVTLTRIGRYAWRSSVCKGPLAVTFTAGWTTPPAAIIAVCCSMAARAAALEPSMLAVQQETSGPFSVSVGAAAAQGGVGTLAGERQILDRYRVRIGQVAGGTWADGLLTTGVCPDISFCDC